MPSEESFVRASTDEALRENVAVIGSDPCWINLYSEALRAWM